MKVLPGISGLRYQSSRFTENLLSDGQFQGEMIMKYENRIIAVQDFFKPIIVCKCDISLMNYRKVASTTRPPSADNRPDSFMRFVSGRKTA